jgi:L-threonylcarbamoyladenylate synthase
VQLVSESEYARGGATVARVADCLRDGGLVLLPTDTVYGLAIHPLCPDTTRARLFAMKRRPFSRNLPVLASSERDIAGLGARLGGRARRLMAAFSPGPLMLALGLDAARTPPWLAGRDEVGVRIPAEDRLLEILSVTGPLLVTSANLHGQDTPESAGSALAALDGEPDLVVDGGIRPTVPSTLVNCNVTPPAVERVGAISSEDIARVLG